ncbi:MAG: long-chain fatty acid--CoA ligase [Thermoleophilaceae bacterium]|nr:long-chain fatty acid--CoA ligase [Thermoleophilaceae bacterium]
MTAQDLPHHKQLKLDSRPPTVAAMFRRRTENSADKVAFRYPDASENWQSLTWGEVARRTDNLAAGLIAVGVGLEQCVAIIAGTRYEWILADFAINNAGATTTTVYPSTIPDDVAYIVSDSSSVVVFAEDDEQIAKLREQRDNLPQVLKVIAFTGETDGDWVISLEELEQLGAEHLAADPTVVDRRIADLTPESIATLIYTSGTTGRPKGVRLSHDGWSYVGAAIATEGFISDADVQFLWLPLAHAFGKFLIVAQLEVGFSTYVDGRVPNIIDNLAIIRPTFMGAAPRIFEKAHGRVVTTVEEEGGAKKKLFDWAFAVGIRVSRLTREGKEVPLLLSIQNAIADKLIFTKVRETFGGRIRYFVSGSAPLSVDIAEWFHAAGLLILEGYGMTETSAASVVNSPSSFRLGTVGRPVAGTELKIAGDGEILVRSPGIMKGYLGLPAETAEALVGDGWMATGDIGEVDQDGFVRITDRKKDLFKTSGGKYVAPTHIEGLFKGISPLVSQIMVHGAERKFVSALITLDPDAVESWSEANGMAGRSYAEVATSPQIHEVIAAQVKELNKKLNPWEQVKKFQILERDLTIEGGEITPSMKMKRKVIEDHNRELLDGFYA